MIQRATAVLSLLLAACVQLPTLTRAPNGILHDELFAAPSQSVDAKQVFALSDAMQTYVRDELAPQLFKVARPALINAVSQSRLRVEYAMTTTSNTAEAFHANARN